MHKRTHVASARTLLASADDSVLAYAALELRMAMEAITYDKLRAYADRLPSEALARWQPPQAMKALLEFEPHAAAEGAVAVARQAADGTAATKRHMLGQKRSFDLTWLRTSYNKLGSLLHLPAPRRANKANEAESLSKTREMLMSILAEVDRVAGATLEGGIARVVYFNCDVCEQLVFCNEEAVRSTKRAVCLEESCSAEHFVKIGEDDSFTFFLDTTGFDCLKCKEITPVENRHLAVGAGFKCNSCGTQHSFVSTHWEYSAHVAPSEGGA